MDRKGYRALAVYAVLFFIFAAAALVIPKRDSFLTIFASVLVGATAAIFLVYVFSANARERATRIDWAIAGLVLNGVCKYAAVRVNGGYFINNPLPSLLVGIGNLGLLMTAIWLGLIVARGLQKPNYLVMAAIVGALTDIFSVYGGPSKEVLNGSMFPYVMYHWGVIGQGEILTCIGAGDFVFLTLYFAGARKFGLDDTKTFAAMVVAFAAGFLGTLLSPSGIPALPFMSAALLIAHGKELKAKMAEA